MSDRQVVVLAASIWVGAVLAWPIPPVLVGLVVFAGWWWRSAHLVACAALALASMLAALAPAVATVESGPFVGEVVVRSDPESITRGMRLDVDAAGVRLEAVAWGAVAGQLRPRLLGERLHVTGRLAPLAPGSTWAERRGVRGRLTIDAVDRWETGRVHHRIANSIRRTIDSGASVLPRRQQVLLVGLVYGDDRNHSAVQRDDFAAAGLTHLLAVSGQNVAFTLVLVGPLMRSLDYRGRFICTLGVLFLFATLTRFEPSVLRASAMAAIAALAVVTARPASSVRLLSLAVCAVVLIDPAIVGSVGFQLSVVASLGILVIAPVLVPLIRAPRLVAEAVAVTSGAQLAVAPLLLWRFDEVPVASLPANVLAGPAAGPVMMWGLTAGLVAGVVPRLAPVLHQPTGLGLAWIEWVASAAALVPLGSLGPVHLILVGGGVPAAVMARTRIARRLAIAVVVVALFAPSVAIVLTAPVTTPLGQGAVLWRDDHTIVLETGAAQTDELLAAMRRSQVRSIDVVVLSRGNLADWDRLRSIRERAEVAAVWAPSPATIPGIHVPADGTTVGIGQRELRTSIVDGELRLVSDASGVSG